ncbi:hypothetical protein D3C72_1756460 [compost metagenome]
MSNALETTNPSSAMIGKAALVPQKPSISPFHFLCASTPSTDTPITLVPRFAHSSASCATAPNSVVHTGVKSFGWEKRIAQSEPIQSWKVMGPWSVSAVKLGTRSLMRSAMDMPSSSLMNDKHGRA